MSAHNGVLQLLLCAAAIYTMFLLWGLLQEKSAFDAYESLVQHIALAAVSTTCSLSMNASIMECCLTFAKRSCRVSWRRCISCTVAVTRHAHEMLQKRSALRHSRQLVATARLSRVVRAAKTTDWCVSLRVTATCTLPAYLRTPVNCVMA